MLPVYLDEISDEFLKIVNHNISEMFYMFIDTAEGSKSFAQMLPIIFPKHYCKNIEKCKEVLYELRNMVLDKYKRNYLKPLFEYVLYHMINWWFDVSEESVRDINFISKFEGFDCINEQEKYWINQVNDAHFYLENMFQDFDFLDLHKFIHVYRFNPDFAENAFGINFSDYADLMPNDIKEEFNKKLPEPIQSTEPYKTEPVLDEAEYQHILKIMRSMSLVIERSPLSFVTLDEEAIRTHFLLQLNGHYEGGASGETFNASGKTDILIRADNRNIFIAECKFWKGQKVFNDAIDQLLGYLSWRDTKCALLIFNKTKDTSSVRNKMHLAMESRSEHRRTVFYSEDGDSRYIFVKKDEPGREIIITTQIYDIPTTSD